jgi:hypothetical protein
VIDTTISQNLVGRKIGPYYIEGMVGQGSTAYIYRALDADDNLVALKVFILFAVMMRAIAKDPAQRFQNGRAMAQELLKIKELLDSQKRSLWQLATEWLAR